MKISIRSIAAGFALLQALAVSAQTTHKPADLLVGDNAPAISVAKWVKGHPVENLDKGKVYVVEFWATWCGPCRESIPHLTQLQKKFGDKATFVGVSAFESDWSGVEPFVKSEGDQMDYNVAMDKVANPADREGDMAKNWMEAAHQNGIPTAFVIDQEGKVAWIGHPMNLEEPLSKVIDGTWDREGYRKKMAAEMEGQARQQEFEKEFMGDMKAKNWAGALKLVDSNSKLPAEEADLMRLAVFSRSGDEKHYAALGEKLVHGTFKDNPMMLNQIAWTIVDPKSTLKHRDLKLAKSAAERAVQLTKHEQPDLLDTLAWVYYWQGDKSKAIELENAALAKAGTADKAALQQSLSTFTKG